MKLVDLDKLSEVIRSAISIFELKGLNTMLAKSILSIINNVPIIDAIPIEWLLNYKRGIENPYGYIIDEAVDEWKKEQER